MRELLLLPIDERIDRLPCMRILLIGTEQYFALEIRSEATGYDLDEIGFLIRKITSVTAVDPQRS